MKSTPLTEIHLGLGAKMAEFAGYNMPIQYSSIKEEHFCVRTSIGVFDVSHMGEFIVRGREAMAFLNSITSNDVSKLAVGDAQYSCLPNLDGGIVDDLLVYRLPETMCAAGEQAFMTVVNASNEEKDWNWMQKFAGNFEVSMYNISERTGLLAIQGPKAAAAMQKLTDINLAEMPYYTFKKGDFAGCKNVIVSATGYTGSGGFEIYADNSDIVKIWNAVFAAGESFGIKPIGLGARDTLRLEMGYCLYGNDINDTTSPLEAGLGWITKLAKGKFTNDDFFQKQKETGVSKKLVGFIVDDRRVPRHDYLIEDADGLEIGVVTSGTQSPSLDKPIGMGYVPTALSKVGSQIFVVAGGKKLAATVVKLPFLQPTV
jgi:aminomethyltransferase